MQKPNPLRRLGFFYAGRMLKNVMEMYAEKRRAKRIPCDIPFRFTVLSAEKFHFQKSETAGKIIDSSDFGIGLMTAFPLQPGHVLQWNDEHKPGDLNMALVKWTQKEVSSYRAGLMFI